MTTPQFPAMWFTSSTPTNVGHTECKMARYQAYHAGAHGTGYRRKALSIPLATGGAVHTGIELIAGWIADYQRAHHGQPPPRLPIEVIRWAAAETAARYDVLARARGFAAADATLAMTSAGADDASSLMPGAATPVAVTLPTAAPKELPYPIQRLIDEQRTLIEAQVWVFASFYLPGILGRYRILGVEAEDAIILDCTCGLGDGFGDIRTHQQRGCTGIIEQARTDLLWEGVHADIRGQVVYSETKTKATQNIAWEKKWEHSIQLLINAHAASARIGKKIDHTEVVALYKGYYGRDRNDPPEAPRYQHTPLVYGYFDPGADGLRPAAWAAKYAWEDEYGKGHKLGKVYRKQPIFDPTLPFDFPGVAEASRVERWMTNMIQPDMAPEFLKVVGPFPHPARRIPLAMQSIQADERWWRDTVEQIREHAINPSTGAWDPLREAAAADALVPRSWQCTSYDGVPCAFKGVCDRDPGWEDPLGTGKFEVRTPHHEPERQEYERLGVVFPPREDEGEGEDLGDA